MGYPTKRWENRGSQADYSFPFALAYQRLTQHPSCFLMQKALAMKLQEPSPSSFIRTKNRDIYLKNGKIAVAMCSTKPLITFAPV